MSWRKWVLSVTLIPSENSLGGLTIPSLPTAKYFELLPEPTALGNELVGCSGVELKHLEMTGNHLSRPNVLGKLRSFASGQITGNATFGSPAVDGKKSNVDLELA